VTPKSGQSSRPVLKRTRGFEIETASYRFQEWIEEVSGKRAAWLEINIEPWTAAFRLMERAGEMIVAEIRVFPNESQPDENDHHELSDGRLRSWAREGACPREYGTWSGDSARVPPGGVPTRVLRKVKAREALRLAFSAEQRLLPKELDRLATHRYRGRRKKRDDALLAQVAVLYEHASREGTHEHSKAVWNALKSSGIYYERGTVRDLIREARRRGFLNEWHRDTGSTATQKAHDLLRMPHKSGDA
jgi:hypothetical protein